MKRFIVPLAALAVIVLDQVTKAWVVASLSLNQQVVLIENFLRLRYIHNTGAAFGLFQGGTWALSIAAVAIVVAILYSVTKMGDSNRLGVLAMGMIVGGALGNLIDRLRLGYVVDFVEAYGPRIQIGNSVYTWPVFNIADSAVTVGVVMLLATILLGSETKTATVAVEQAEAPKN